jgi:DNA modification methylase
LEPTIELYVSHLVDVFREVRRVLHPSGVVWLNLGDSYTQSGGFGHKVSDSSTMIDKGGQYRQDNLRLDVRRNFPNLKPKDLCMIPARVALALQADGWWLRSQIIWHKPNCMPESVTDRPTTSHEYVFLLAKRARYFYDAEAIKGESITNDPRKPYGSDGAWELDGRNKWEEGAGQPQERDASKRNRRTVWTIPTQPYAGAHFATFPPALVEPMIKAGSSERGVCPECGGPWERVIEKETSFESGSGKAGNKPAGKYNGTEQAESGEYDIRMGPVVSTNTTGWRPTCACGAPDGLQPDDLEIIATPTGERVGEDPTLNTGRAGYNRPRGDSEGQRPITRYEQRHYAHQLKNSPYRAEMATEALSAFEHYIRTDKSGARPVPQGLLEMWIEHGWIERVIVPEWQPPAPIPATVLDPFCGSGTTLQVARQLGRRGIGLDLSYDYLHDQARERLGLTAWDAWHNGKNGTEGEPLEALPLFEGLPNA